MFGGKQLSTVRLKDIFLIQSGGTPRRNVPSYWKEGTIPWVKISDMIDIVVDHTEEKITLEGLNSSSAKIFKPGTILVSIFATLGETSVLSIEAATNQAIAGLNNVSENRTSYLFYAVRNLKQDMLEIGRGMSQKNINVDILGNLKIKIPPKELQDEFDNYVRSIDKLKFVFP